MKLFKTKKKMKYYMWLDQWLKTERQFLKESTYATYTNIIENHIKPNLGNYYCHLISESMLQEFIYEKLNSGRLDGKGGLSRKTVQDIIILCKATLNSASRNKYSNTINFNIKIPSDNDNKEVKIFSKKEETELKAFTYKSNDSRALGILICLFTGLRIGEICSLKWENININSATLEVTTTLQRIYINDKTECKSKIIITPPKTRTSKRIIPINSKLLTKLREFQSDNEHFVLTNSYAYIEPRTYRNYFNKVLFDLKLNKLNFHCLRHTFATKCIEVGIDHKTLSELLGHSSVLVTLNIYVHPQMQHKKKCVELLVD